MSNLPESAEESFLRKYLERMIVHEDDSVLVVNKPAGVPVYGVSKICPFGIVEAVAASKRLDTHPVHRLDRDTSGLLLLGKSSSSRRALSKQFSGRRVSKIYLALVDGQWDPILAGIIAPLTRNEPVRVELSEQARKAATAFTLVAHLEDERYNPYSLLKIKIFTGRTHQIRAHLSSLGHPIVGDKTYNFDPTGASRQLLHAYEMTFIHPKTKQPLTLRAPIETDFGQAILGFRNNTATDSYREIISEIRGF
ncbi:MAG: RluA family pseudouridine synthase [Candidatus Daviesbacteria bacterium]|nr:RluA family pseudouridine synthase [Candidatus Daviesbacteria bacterium]